MLIFFVVTPIGAGPGAAGPPLPLAARFAGRARAAGSF